MLTAIANIQKSLKQHHGPIWRQTEAVTETCYGIHLPLERACNALSGTGGKLMLWHSVRMWGCVCECMYAFWGSLNAWSTVQADIWFCLPHWGSGFLPAPPTLPKGALSGLESHTFRSSLLVIAVITVCTEVPCRSFCLAAQTIGWLRLRNSSLQLPQPLTDTIYTSSIYTWPLCFLSTRNL